MKQDRDGNGGQISKFAVIWTINVLRAATLTKKYPPIKNIANFCEIAIICD